MGKIVVKFPNEDVLPLATPHTNQSFKDDVAYLLIGGRGGLGRSIASWMVSGGAKHIMVLSRSAGKSDSDRSFIKELAEASCTLHCFTGDVNSPDCVREVVNKAPKPIAGVMQMAMVLHDVGFTNMDHDSWTAAVRPKVLGTWNLHNLLPKQLDFFVMFGSTCGTLASYGQANYAAANVYLDAFVQFRHKLGLPASVIDICAVGDVGYVSQSQSMADMMEGIVGRLISEQDFLHYLQLAIARSSQKYVTPHLSTLTGGYRNQSQVVLYNPSDLPITDPQSSIIWKRDPRMAIYRNIQKVTKASDGQGSDSLRRFLASLASDPSKLELKSTAMFLAQEIAQRVLTFLMRDDAVVDTSQTLTAMSVDSLVSIEIRNWWKQTFGTDVPVLELRDGGSIERLGELPVERLGEKYNKAPST